MLYLYQYFLILIFNNFLMQLAKSFVITSILLICKNIIAQNYTHPFDYNQERGIVVI